MKKRSGRVAIFVVGVGLLALVTLCGIAAVLTALTARGFPPMGLGGRVAVLPVRGVIMSGKATPWLMGQGLVFSDDVVELISRAAGDPSIAALVLDIDSPGGSVVGSADIYAALEEFPKPIVASFGEVAASGGYYIACAADVIVVRPATTTGSIGVILSTTNYAGLLSKLGIQRQVIKSGAHKDQGAWHRPLTKEEIDMFQTMVDEAYQDFVQVVVRGRGLSEQDVRAVADGRVFSGRQAVALGLADRLGDLDDAIEIAADRAGLSGPPPVIRLEQKPSFWDQLLSSYPFGGFWDVALAHWLQYQGIPRVEYLYAVP